MVHDRPFTVSLSSGYNHVAVRSTNHYKYYSQTYPQALTLSYALTDWYRLSFSQKMAFANYKSKGRIAEISSKQGAAYTSSVTNTFYLDKQKRVSFQIGYDYRRDDVEGSNASKFAHSARSAYNFPVWHDWTGSANFKYKYTEYPHSNLPVKRWDEEYTAGVYLTIPLGPQWELSPSYSFTNNLSKDDANTYLNHAAGASLSYSF